MKISGSYINQNMNYNEMNLRNNKINIDVLQHNSSANHNFIHPRPQYAAISFPFQSLWKEKKL